MQCNVEEPLHPRICSAAGNDDLMSRGRLQEIDHSFNGPSSNVFGGLSRSQCRRGKAERSHCRCRKLSAVRHWLGKCLVETVKDTTGRRIGCLEVGTWSGLPNMRYTQEVPSGVLFVMIGCLLGWPYPLIYPTPFKVALFKHIASSGTCKFSITSGSP